MRHQGLVLITIGVMLALALQVRAQEPTGGATTYLPLVVSAITPSPVPTATTAPTATIAPTSTPTLPPPSFVSCATPPASPGSAPNYPVRITNIDKAAETVTLQNTSASTVSLTGYTMCSITGGQTHPISGSLAPGQSTTFPNGGGPIWNNASSDPGALYNASGQLVSYWAD